jgi:hypothetical protein
MDVLSRSSPEELETIRAQMESLKEKRQAPGIVPGFNAQAQYIDTTGAHAFVAPSTSDLRGPCPGLNALANHNYLPHNGVATITQFVQATNSVFGMGIDLATFLSVYGAVIDGDLTSWSIGGPAPSGLLGGTLSSIGLLSEPQGISGSHNKYESDVSPTRGDLYEYGNDYLVQMPQFIDLFNTQPNAATANYDLDVLTDFRAYRFNQSIHNNPYFFNGPFSGVIVQPAAYTFIYRFMANKSAEYPMGLLNQDVLKSFFAITGDSPANFKYTPGYEKIPNNWYKRAIGDEYTIAYYSLDLNVAALKYPEFLAIGGNTGKVNTFTGVDLQDLTGGIYNLATLAQGNNAICFATQFAQQAAPDLLKGVLSNVLAGVEKLASAITQATGTFNCPQITSIDSSQFSPFPGSTGAL